MNRRSFFSFLAAVPVVSVSAVVASPSPPKQSDINWPEVKDRDAMFEAMNVPHPKGSWFTRSPDWMIYPAIPCDPVENLSEERKCDFVYAWVTDDIFFTREAVRAGFSRVRGWEPRTFIDTGGRQALFMKQHSYYGKPLEAIT